MTGVRPRPERPGIAADEIARVRRTEAQGVGEERLKRAADIGAEDDRQVARSRLPEAVPIDALEHVARQLLERQRRIREQDKVQDRRRERARRLEVDRGRRELVGLIEIAADHSHGVRREPEHPGTDVEQRRGMRGRGHPVADPRCSVRVQGGGKRHRDQAPVSDGQADPQRVEESHPVHGDDLTVSHRVGTDTVDLERIRHAQGDLTHGGPLVEVRSRRANRGGARLDPHDVPIGIHRGGQRVAARPDEADVGDLLRVPRRQYLPGAGGRVGVGAPDEHRQRIDGHVDGVVSLGGKHAGRERHTTEHHRQRGGAAGVSHAPGPGRVGPNL